LRPLLGPAITLLMSPAAELLIQFALVVALALGLFGVGR
jgi:hypothetical protein